MPIARPAKVPGKQTKNSQKNNQNQRRRNDDKNNFWEVKSKGGSAGGSKRGSTGDPPWNFIVGLKHRKKQHFGKSHFYCHRFFPGNTVTIILDNCPPSTLQGLGLGCRKNPRIIVGENYCHFGASYRTAKTASLSDVSAVFPALCPGPNRHLLRLLFGSFQPGYARDTRQDRHGVYLSTSGWCPREFLLFTSVQGVVRVHAKGVVLCEGTCFCLLSAF